MLWSASDQAELIEATEGTEGAVAAVRRLAVASLLPGVGVSTVTTLLAENFARHRSGRILVAERRSGQAATMLSGASARGIDAITIEDGGNWQSQIAPIARNFDIVLTDGGVVAGLPDLTAIAHSAHALCLVTSDTRAVAENAIALAQSLQNNPAAPRPVVVFVDTQNVKSTWPILLAPRLPFPVTRIPYDRARAQGSATPSRGARRGALLTAAALLHQSEPGMSSR